jgi:uncharacterized delta-60 repeat protein
MKKSLLFMAATVGLSLPLFAQAAAGSLDPSFGSGGTVLTDFGNSNGDAGRAVAIAPGGKIVVAGFSQKGASGDPDFALARYNRDGSLDPSFGSGGKVLTDIGSGADYLFDAAVTPRGKIVAAGDASGTGGIHDFAVVRYLAR